MTSGALVDRGPRSVLVAGLGPGLSDWLQAQFRTLHFRVAEEQDDILEELQRGESSLLVLSEVVSAFSVRALLEKLRSLLPDAGVPVIACLPASALGDEARSLVRDLGVERILYQPVDRMELARQIGTILQLPIEPASEVGPTPDRRAGLTALWERFRGTLEQRLTVMEDAAIAAIEGKLDPSQQRTGEREAHKFAGSIGTFGFMEASRLASTVEAILARPDPPGEVDALRLADLLVAIRSELEKPPATLAPEGEPSAPPEARPVLLLMSRDQSLVERVSKESRNRGLELVALSEPEALRTWIADASPVAALVDVDNDAGGNEETWEVLVGLAAREPPVPALVLSERGTFTDRLEVARRGGRGFLEKPVAPARAVELALSLASETAVEGYRVLSVDDDPAVLATLSSLLEREGLTVETLEDPLRFWDVLEQMVPDLLVLDVDMPHVSGIEICRMVRNDLRRRDLVILFLTARTDSETVQRIFAAGADDFVSKPIIPAELRSRIRNRLERLQLQRRLSDTDFLTGLFTRRKSEEVLERYLLLAQRQQLPLSLAVLDLDRFKAINDQYGHEMGDAVLRRLGQLLTDFFRGEDVVARWGGEEFVIGMYGSNRENTVRRLRELLETLRREEFRRPGHPVFQVTFSAGVATFPDDGRDVHSLYRGADAALLEAKSRGRARVLPVASSRTGDGSEAAGEADIVLVEDDEALGTLLVHTLQARGYQVRWIRDGQEAMEALEGPQPALRPRLVLLDIDLPGLDGMTVLRKLTRTGALDSTRVIMLTLRSGEAEVYKSLELGAFDHVGKPFSIPVLLQRIGKALEEE